MDFKFDDGMDENGVVEKKGLSDKTKLIIVIIVALVVGFSVFFVTFAFLGNKKSTQKETPAVKTTLSLTDEEVITDYNMLTYGVQGKRTSKYTSGINITGATSFSNSEKYYYALQFCVKADLEDSGKKDEDGNEIYTLPKSSMDIYMERYFGPDVTYSTDSEISNTFKFTINGFDTGIMKYDSSSSEFKITFTSNYSDAKTTEDNTFIDDCYYELVDAYKYSDGRMVLTEKILYTSAEANDGGSYNVSLYADSSRTNSIGTVNNVTKDSVSTSAFVKPSNYNNAGTIIYNLKMGEYGYYIVDSEVK